MTDKFSDIIDEHVRAVMLERAACEERTAEAALQSGKHGMSTIHHGTTTLFKVDPLVPYGQHYIFPSKEAYENFTHRQENP